MKLKHIVLWMLILAGGGSLLNAQTGLRRNLSKVNFRTFKIGGAGRWDYLAVYGTNLYVSHGDRVHVLDKQTGNAVAVINKTPGVHGIAFVPALGRGYISDGGASDLTVFDLNTNQVISHILTGKDPDAILYDSGFKRLIVCNGHDNSLSIIDPQKEKVTATIAVGGKPETAVSDGPIVYVNLEDKSAIAVVDLNSNKVIGGWPLAPAEGPTGLAYDAKKHLLFSGCDKMLAISDTKSGKLIKTLPIGEGCDGVIYDSQTGCVYASNGGGNITVINADSDGQFRVVKSIVTQRGARTIALDPDSHLLYLPTADFGKAVDDSSRPPVLNGSFHVIVVNPGN